MGMGLRPEVGEWFQDLVDGHRFQVVAIDEHMATIELQDADGDLDELDLVEWHQRSLRSVQAPDNPAGPADELEDTEREYSRSGEGLEPVPSRTPSQWADVIDDYRAEIPFSLDPEE